MDRKRCTLHDWRNLKEGLTFDDVQLIPQYSSIHSRSEEYISTKTKISRNWTINFPVISANMDTVTGPKLIMEISKHGANGVLHRLQSATDECENVCELKAAGVSPIIASIGVYIYPAKSLAERFEMFDAYIPPQDDLERARELILSGASIILIDVAHGHHIRVKHMIEHLIAMRQRFNLTFDIIAGNVATGNAVTDLISWGADGVKCGIGNGAACTTRINTGFGVPSLTSLLECNYARVRSDRDVAIIWDGGIKTSGDVAKAIAAGADAVMIGSLFAGTEESPGMFKMRGLYPNKGIVKEYRGSASFDCKLSHGYSAKNVEGISTNIPYKGPVEWVMNYLKENFLSSMSYAGASTIEELRSNAVFVRITGAGSLEASPHIEMTQ